MSLGEQLRDYISVDCAAEYVSKIVLQNEITGIINCCSSKPISVRRFVEEIFKNLKTADDVERAAVIFKKACLSMAVR